MRYNNPRTIWACARCGKHTQTLHEIIYGHGNRDICISYSIQAPLCIDCHNLVHTNKDKYTKELLNWLGFFGDEVHEIIRAVLVKRYRKKLEDVFEMCEMKINSREMELAEWA
jgi:hypothetical protein